MYTQKTNLYISKNWSVAFIVVTLQLSHISGHIILFFLPHLYSLLLSLLRNKKKYLKKKTLTLPISPHLLLYFFQSFPSLFASLSSHYSLLYGYSIIFSLLNFDFSSPYFIFYKFNIISHIQSIFFQQKTLVFSLSRFLVRQRTLQN